MKLLDQSSFQYAKKCCTDLKISQLLVLQKLECGKKANGQLYQKGLARTKKVI
jgi:hypothetical protein